MQIFSDDRNRTWAFVSAAPTTASIRRTGRRGRARETRSISSSASRRRCPPTRSSNRISRITRGHGYYSDPYKTLDTRPTSARYVRLAHPLQPILPRAGRDAASSYRYCTIRSVPRRTRSTSRGSSRFPHGSRVTPGLRYYTQTAADFYYNPPFPNGLRRRARITRADTRLSAFGAFTPASPSQSRWPRLERRTCSSASIVSDSGWRARGYGSPGLRCPSPRAGSRRASPSRSTRGRSLRSVRP